MSAKRSLFAIVTALAAALLLFFLTAGLKENMEAREQAAMQGTMSTLLPGSAPFQEEAYSGEDTCIAAVFQGTGGYVVETTVPGYVDEITILVGVSNDGTVQGMKILQMNETHGLGQRALTDLTFLRQLLGSRGDLKVGETVNAMTGATVSSKAIVKAINAAVAFVTGADVGSGATEWGG